MYPLLYLKWITNKDLLGSRWNSAQCYVAARMGGQFQGEQIHCICIAESLCCSLETITTLFIAYTPTQNKRFKVWNQKKFFLHLCASTNNLNRWKNPVTDWDKIFAKCVIDKGLVSRTQKELLQLNNKTTHLKKKILAGMKMVYLLWENGCFFK